MANYRFELTYSVEKSVIDENSKQSMKNVYKMFGSAEHQSVIAEIVYEYKFEQNESYYWLAAQSVLDKSMKKELKKSNKHFFT